MNDFLSCDWGTSTLRINLVSAHTSEIICGETSDEGMARIFNLWKLTGDADKNKRVQFYLNILQQHIKSIELKLNQSLDGCRLIISGMASSSIGFVELPYSELPFSLSGDSLKLKHIPGHKGFVHTITIVSGIKSVDDVMRGEETQLIGCTGVSNGIVNNQIFIFPGTHSKHIYINSNEASGFKTYMTGDFFELLSQKSILSNSVEKNNQIETPENLTAFKNGITDGAQLNLLNAAFKVRTNSLFEVYPGHQNFNYLIGLLIGTELKDLENSGVEKIHLLCGSGLERYYRIALEELGLAGKLQTYPPQWVDDAVVRAHYRINNQIEVKYE
ncbi:MAG: 2-keto-3-deoxy-galactonokinase [Mucilaginibacter sp.]|nr:2-keto-3-deoxy-galactonokinase [Mucilaginibacter sp.]